MILKKDSVVKIAKTISTLIMTGIGRMLVSDRRLRYKLKLASLPPTSEASIENLHRCHLQVEVWDTALYCGVNILWKFDFK